MTYAGRLRALAWLLLVAPLAAHAATASGRNWRLDIVSLRCEAGSSLVLGAHIRYLGPHGPVEAPIIRLVDGAVRFPPRALVWKSGERKLAQWLSSGGVTHVQSESVGEFQIKFDAGAAAGALQLEFGDIRAFPLSGKGGCRAVLKPEDLGTPRKARGDKVPPVSTRIYRGAYPCTPKRTVEADHPPQLPRQLLLFGHGFLPNAREVDFPTGKAPAQPYFYKGADDLVAVENAARQAIAADFPEYRGDKFFFFNWGTQKSLSGNDVYSIGIYELGRCP